jgi:hypothetical protein
MRRDGKTKSLFLFFVNRKILHFEGQTPVGLETAGKIDFSAHPISGAKGAAEATRSDKNEH